MKIVQLILLLGSLALQTIAQPKITEKNKSAHLVPGLNKVAEIYNFSLSVTEHVTEIANDRPGREYDIVYYINNAKAVTAVKILDKSTMGNNDMLMIYDTVNKKTTMLRLDKKTGMSVPLMLHRSNDKVSCNNTGKGKKTKGYKCIEHTCVNEVKQMKAELLTSDKVHMNLTYGIERTSLAQYMSLFKNIDGLLVSGTLYRNNKKTATIELVNVNNHEQFTINMNDYKTGKK